MPERTSITQVVQIGAETTAGTQVAATKKFQTLGIEPSPNAEIDKFRPAGTKYNHLTALSKEWVVANVSGRGSYTEIVYALSSIIDAATITTPMGATNARLWTFTPDTSAADAPQSYTVQHGSSVRADRFTYGTFVEFGMTFNRTSIDITGSMIGEALEDGITMTAVRQVTDGVTNTDTSLVSATASFTSEDVGAEVSGTGITSGTKIASVTNGTTVVLDTATTATATGVTVNIGVISSVELVPILASQVSVYMDSSAAGLGGTQLTRVLSAEFKMSNRFNALWVLDATQASFVALVEIEPEVMLSVMVEADSNGMALLTAMRNGTRKFIRVEATGATDSIESGQDYTFTLDFSGEVTATGGFSDQDGVYAFQVDFTAIHDDTWGKAYEVAVKNALTAL